MQALSLRPRGVSLREVVPEATLIGCDDVLVGSICSDAAAVMPGDVFLASLTADGDTHEDYLKAVRRGAAAVIGERLLPTPIPMAIVPDSRKAYARLCQAVAGAPSREMPVIGVTGTGGKTCVCELLASVFKLAGYQVGVIDSVRRLPDQWSGAVGAVADVDQAAAVDAAGNPLPTTPEPPEMARRLAEMEADGVDVAIVEISSSALADYRLEGIALDAAVITNIRREHLDEHGAVANYRQIKGRILDLLKPEGFAVMNADDPSSKHLIGEVSHPLMTVGLRSPAEVTGEIVERRLSEQTFLLEAGCETAPVRTLMIGEHHALNCLCAAAVGLVYNIPLGTIVSGLERITSIPGRLSRVEAGQPFGVFVDEAKTPDALATTLRALRQATRGDVWLVYGCDADGPAAIRPALGRVAEKGARHTIITSDNPRHERPLELAHQLLDGYDRPHSARVMPSRQDAIVWALSQAKPGDSVLIAGKGAARQQVIDGRRYAFDDVEIARAWLAEADFSESLPEEEPATIRLYHKAA